MNTHQFSWALALGVLAASGQLQEAVAAPAPVLIAQQSTLQIESFQLRPVEQLDPGSELVFTLEGTPRSRASLTISGIANNIPMREVESGIYEGRYTVRRQDRLRRNTAVRADLRQGQRTVSARLEEPLIADVAADNTRPAYGSSNVAINIDRFTVAPVDTLEAGTELRFTLEGTPRSRANFSVGNLARSLPMREVSPGIYEGRYTVRRQDNLTAGTDVTAVLQGDGQSARTRLDQSLLSAATSGSQRLTLEVLAPANNSQVESSTVEIRGRSASQATVAVQIQATNALGGLLGLNQNLLNRSVQTDGQGNFSFAFQPPAVKVPGTRYEVSLNARKGDQVETQTLILFQR